MKKRSRTYFLSLMLGVLGAPFFVYAKVSGPINVDISSLPTTGTNSLGHFINGLYQSSLGLGALAAFVVITAGGVFYAVSGAINKKQEGLDWIKGAIFGLVLLLGAFVIFNTINPQVTKLQEPGAGSGGLGGGLRDLQSSQPNLNVLTATYNCPSGLVRNETRSSIVETTCSGDTCAPAQIQYFTTFYVVYDQNLAALSAGNQVTDTTVHKTYPATSNPTTISANVADYRKNHFSTDVALVASVPSESSAALHATNASGGTGCLNGEPSLTTQYTSQTDRGYYAVCSNAASLIQTALSGSKGINTIKLFYTRIDASKSPPKEYTDTYVFSNQCFNTLTLQQALDALSAANISADLTSAYVQPCTYGGGSNYYECHWEKPVNCTNGC